jgi:hypothetical protein
VNPVPDLLGCPLSLAWITEELISHAEKYLCIILFLKIFLVFTQFHHATSRILLP